MHETMIVQGRTLTPGDVQCIQSLIKNYPQWHRRRLSLELAALWNWTNSAGRIKDMAARGLLLKLDRKGLIQLPARRREPVQRKGLLTQGVSLMSLARENISESLQALTPLDVELLSTRHPSYQRFLRYLTSCHYLGWRGAVGEHAAYLVRDCKGRDLACLVFGAAAWKVQCRDRFIGWDHAIRQRRLNFIVNNHRFLILPGVRVAHLASHILGRIARRLSADWQIKYGHPVYMAETFVERDRFKGTCYRAANWQRIGQTQGRSRQDRYGAMRVPVKDIYVYPLIPQFRERLCHADG